MIRRHFTPRTYQTHITAHILRTPRCNVWAGMGLGKTVSTLNAIDILWTAGLLNRPVLVCAPLRVAQSTWPDEAAKWKHLERVTVTPIVGNAKERLRRLVEAATRFSTTRPGPRIYTINYENIPWMMETLAKAGLPWPFEMVIADESTKLKGFRKQQGTQRAKALAKVAHTHVTRFVNLTGTPSPNGLKDLWGQVYFVDAGQRLGRSFTDFSDRWFYKSPDGYSILPHSHSQGQIESRLKDVTQSLNAADYFDIKEPIKIVKQVDLPDHARERYREMENQMFTELSGHEIEAFNAASVTMKCLQLASGAAYLPRKKDEDGNDIGPLEWATVHDAKLDVLDEIIEEAAGMPVLVAYHFKSDLERLQKAFPQGKVLDKNPKTISDWNAGKIPVMFAHPASAGHGLNLQDGGNILVFFSHNWNLEEYLQIRERIGPTRQLQAGHNRPVFEYYIVARNTVDEMVMARRDSKREVQDLLMEAMKKRDEQNV